MFRSCLISFVAAFALCCGTAPPEQAVKQYSIEQFLGNESVSGGSFSHDEQRLLYGSDKAGVVNAFSVPVSGGDATQLTQSVTDNAYPVSYFPNDDRLLYSADGGGNEISHLYLRAENGETRDLTPGERNRALFHGWAHDRKSFFFTSNERNPAFMDLYEMDAATLEPKRIFDNDGYDVGPVSPDKSLVALNKQIGNHKSDIFLYDLKSKKVRQLTESEGDAEYFAVQFSPDATGLYVISNADNDFYYLTRFDLSSGEMEVIAKPDWDVMWAGLSHDGSYLYYASEQRCADRGNHH